LFRCFPPLAIPHPPIPTLFPYTTLFRSRALQDPNGHSTIHLAGPWFVLPSCPSRHIVLSAITYRVGGNKGRRLLLRDPLFLACYATPGSARRWRLAASVSSMPLNAPSPSVLRIVASPASCSAT